MARESRQTPNTEPPTWNVSMATAKTHTVTAERLIIHSSGALVFYMSGDPEDQPKEVVPAGQWTGVMRKI
jgi:hypothetical protein